MTPEDAKIILDDIRERETDRRERPKLKGPTVYAVMRGTQMYGLYTSEQTAQERAAYHNQEFPRGTRTVVVPIEVDTAGASTAGITTDRQPTFQEKREAAIMKEHAERLAEVGALADVVLGTAHGTIRGRRIGEYVKLGGDYVVEVIEHKHDGRGDMSTWTFVQGGKRSNWFHYSQEGAILHLIASRYDDNPNSNHAAAFYAGRVLGLPASE